MLCLTITVEQFNYNTLMDIPVHTKMPPKSDAIIYIILEVSQSKHFNQTVQLFVLYCHPISYEPLCHGFKS